MLFKSNNSNNADLLNGSVNENSFAEPSQDPFKYAYEQKLHSREAR